VDVNLANFNLCVRFFIFTDAKRGGGIARWRIVNSAIHNPAESATRALIQIPKSSVSEGKLSLYRSKLFRICKYFLRIRIHQPELYIREAVNYGYGFDTTWTFLCGHWKKYAVRKIFMIMGISTVSKTRGKQREKSWSFLITFLNLQSFPCKNSKIFLS
jgi:hypothetical protein